MCGGGVWECIDNVRGLPDLDRAFRALLREASEEHCEASARKEPMEGVGVEPIGSSLVYRHSWKETSMEFRSLQDVYAEQLNDLRSAEQQLVEALPKMVRAASSEE